MMIVTTSEQYYSDNWHRKNLELFDTNTGIQYQFSVYGGKGWHGAGRDSVRLQINSIHSGMAEDHYGLRYNNKEAIAFFRQLDAIVDNKSLIDHWCGMALSCLGEARDEAPVLNDIPF